MIRKLFLWVTLLLSGGARVVLVLLYASLPAQDGQMILEGLAEPVTVEPEVVSVGIVERPH